MFAFVIRVVVTSLPESNANFALISFISASEIDVMGKADRYPCSPGERD